MSCTAWCTRRTKRRRICPGCSCSNTPIPSDTVGMSTTIRVECDIPLPTCPYRPIGRYAVPLRHSTPTALRAKPRVVIISTTKHQASTCNCRRRMRDWRGGCPRCMEGSAIIYTPRWRGGWCSAVAIECHGSWWPRWCPLRVERTTGRCAHRRGTGDTRPTCGRCPPTGESIPGSCWRILCWTL